MAPRFLAGPTVSLRNGPLNGSVPLRLGWQAGDPGGLRSVALTRPAATALPAAGRRFVTAPAGRATMWTWRAIDRTGNASYASVTRTPSLYGETAGTASGTWAVVPGDTFFGRRALRGTAAGSSMTYRFTGRGVQLVTARSPGSGSATIWLDGERLGSIDLRSSTVLTRQGVWSMNWPSSGSHTVRVVVDGTRGRPGVYLDGLVVLR